MVSEGGNRRGGSGVGEIFEPDVRLHNLTYVRGCAAWQLRDLDDGRQRFMEGGEVDDIRRDRINGDDPGGRCALTVLLHFRAKGPALGPDGRQLSPQIPAGIESSEIRKKSPP